MCRKSNMDGSLRIHGEVMKKMTQEDAGLQSEKGREYLKIKHLGGVDENQFNPGGSSIPNNP